VKWFARSKVTIWIEVRINGVPGLSDPVKVEVENGQTITIDQPIQTRFEAKGKPHIGK
jgi:hypothetical protein